MSDAQVQAHLDQLERWLSDPGWIPDPSAMALWDAGFHAALATAERGSGWEPLVLQGRALNERLKAHASGLALAMEEIRLELQQQASASQALKAYQPTQA